MGYRPHGLDDWPRNDGQVGQEALELRGNALKHVVRHIGEGCGIAALEEGLKQTLN